MCIILLYLSIVCTLLIYDHLLSFNCSPFIFNHVQLHIHSLCSNLTEKHDLVLKCQSVQLLSRVRLFATPGITAYQASLSITNSRSSLKLKSIELVMPSSHLILCRPLLLLPPIPPSIRVFSNESALRMRWPKYWSFSFSISPSNEYPGLISFRMDWLDHNDSQFRNNPEQEVLNLVQHIPRGTCTCWHMTYIAVQAELCSPQKGY